MKSILIPLVAIAIATSLQGAALAELNPAEGSIQTADGTFTSRNMTLQRDFKLELMYLPPAATMGHWVPLTWDTKGRMIAASYDTDHLLRLTIPNVGQPGDIKVENMMEGVGGAEGLLVAFNALYMNVNRSPTARHGVYKLTDTNNDDKLDKREFLWSFQGSGDHGDHQLRAMPDGKRIIGIFGNDTPPTLFSSSRVPMIWNEDQLLPRMDDRGVGGHAAGRFRPGGQTISMLPDGSDIRLETMGYRNPVDFSYNKDGELFVYDSDLEYDKGMPWYRPTRVTHHISGGDYGWAHGNGKMPAYYIDTFGVVAPVGSGSPVGTSAGTGFKAPARYQDGMFLDDWSYGNLYFVEMHPQGSSYTGKAELFASGNPFAVSGITVNPNDGSLWFATTGTQLYRVTYTGTGNVEPTKPDTTMAAMRKERQAMEDLHGRKAPGSINAIFAELNNSDRGIRYAARVALEWQDPALWTTRALDEKDSRRAIAALVALTRVSGTDIEHRANLKKPAPDHALQARILTALDRISWSDLSYQDKLDLMRAYHLAFIRFGEEDTSAAGGAQQQLYGVRNKLKLPDEAIRQRIISKFNPIFPTEFRELNWELGELLSYLEAPDFVEKGMAQLRKAAPTPTYFPIEEWVNPQQRQRGTPGTLGGLSNAFIQTQEDQWKYAELLRTVNVGWTPALKEEYLKWFRTAAATQEGGASFQGYLSFMHGKQLLKLTDAEKAGINDKTVLDAPVARAGGGGGRGGGGGGGGGAGGAAPGGGRAAGGRAAGAGGAGGAGGGAVPQATPGGNL